MGNRQYPERKWRKSSKAEEEVTSNSVASLESQTTRAALRPKGKDFLRRRLCPPREGNAAPPTSLRFYRVHLVGWGWGWKASRKKELPRAKSMAISRVFTRGGAWLLKHQEAVVKLFCGDQGSTDLWEVWNIQFPLSLKGLGSTQVIHLDVLGDFILGQDSGPCQHKWMTNVY